MQQTLCRQMNTLDLFSEQHEIAGSRLAWKTSKPDGCIRFRILRRTGTEKMMARSRQPRRTPQEAFDTLGVSGGPYEVELQRHRKRRLRLSAPENDRSGCSWRRIHSHHTVFRMIQDAIKSLIPHDPLNRKYALSASYQEFSASARVASHLLGRQLANEENCSAVYLRNAQEDGDTNDPHAFSAEC